MSGSVGTGRPEDVGMSYDYYQCAKCLLIRKRRRGTICYDVVEDKEEIVAARLMGLLPPIRDTLICVGCSVPRK